jgi:glutaredoxin-like protein
MAVIKDKDRAYLKKQFNALENPVKIVVFSQEVECEYCKLTRSMAEELADTSPKLAVEVYDFVKDEAKVKAYGVDKIPALILEGASYRAVRFFGVPAGYEFTTLVEDILEVSKGTPDLTEKTKNALAGIEKSVHMQVFISPTCPYCPRAVRMAHKFALASKKVTGDMIEVSEFSHLAVKYDVQGVPKTVINEDLEVVGAQPEEAFLEKVLEAAKR